MKELIETMIGDRNMHLILMYCKSHIYELHSLLAAFITIILMQHIKKPIKRKIARFVLNMAAKKDKWKEHKVVYYKRMNTIVVLVAEIMGGVSFELVNIFSPLVVFKWFTTLTTGAIAIAGYKILEQMFQKQPHVTLVERYGEKEEKSGDE